MPRPRQQARPEHPATAGRGLAVDQGVDRREGPAQARGPAAAEDAAEHGGTGEPGRWRRWMRRSRCSHGTAPRKARPITMVTPPMTRVSTGAHARSSRPSQPKSPPKDLNTTVKPATNSSAPANTRLLGGGRDPPRSPRVSAAAGRLSVERGVLPRWCPGRLEQVAGGGVDRDLQRPAVLRPVPPPVPAPRSFRASSSSSPPDALMPVFIGAVSLTLLQPRSRRHQAPLRAVWTV